MPRITSGADGDFQPLGFRHLRKFTGLGDRFDFLSFLAWSDKAVLFDDFLVDAYSTFNWLVTAAGTSAAADVVASTANGVFRLNPGTADNDMAAIAGGLYWKGDLNCGMQVYLTTDDVSDVKVEAGFFNLANRNTAVVNAYDTPSFQTNCTDVAVAIVDTDGTNGNRWAFCTDGTTTNMNATATQSGEAIGSTAATKTTAVATTYDKIAVTVTGDRARLYRNGKSLAHHGATLASRIEGGSVIAPVVTAVARVSTDSPLVDIDYILVWQDRTT